MENELLYIVNLKKHWDSYENRINALNGFPNLNPYYKKKNGNTYKYYFYTIVNEDGETRNKHISEKKLTEAFDTLRANGLYYPNRLRSFESSVTFVRDNEGVLRDGVMPKALFDKVIQEDPSFCEGERIINMHQWIKEYPLAHQ